MGTSTRTEITLVLLKHPLIYLHLTGPKMLVLLMWNKSKSGPTQQEKKIDQEYLFLLIKKELIRAFIKSRRFK